MLGRLLAFFRRNRLDRELDDEVGFHLDMLESEFRAKGLGAKEARLAARREFGAVEPMKETYRDRRGIRWLDELAQDLRYGLRGLRKNPGFTATAVLSLALGIGVNAAVFSVFHALLLRTLPVARPGELVTLYRTGAWGRGLISLPLYRDLRDHTDVFDGVLARHGVLKARLAGERAQFLDREYVSGNYFSVLGVQPAAGRLLTEQDAKVRGQSPVAVLSYDAWRNRFGLDAGILGRTITMDDEPFTVVGVAQPGFHGVEVETSVEIWVPLTMNALATDDTGLVWLWAMGRRKPGVAEAKIQAEANTILSRYLAFNYGKQPESGFKRMAMQQRIEVRPGGIGISFMRAEFGEPIRLLMGAVALVLLIACANVAGLQLARGAARRREMALRFSLGAGRWRLVRQWLAESAMLAAAGALLGWIFAAWAGGAAASLIPGLFEHSALSVESGGAVLVFVAAAAIASALLFGVVAGLGSTAIDVAPGLREGAGSSAGRLRLGIRRGLVVAQVALSVVLVVAAGLFIRSLAGLTALDLGMRNHGVLTFSLDAPHSYTQAALQALPSRLLDRLSTLPGVLSASAGFPGTYQVGSSSGDLFIPGLEKSAQPNVARQNVYPRFFETLGSPPVTGREFDLHDRPGSRKVAVVNQALAQKFFGGQDPIGRGVGVHGTSADTLIVGLVPNIQHDGVREPAVPVIYLPALQEPPPMPPQFLLHATIPPRDLLRLIRREAAALDPALEVDQAETVQQRIDRSIFSERMLALLSACFGALALTLAAIGLYGVISFVVTRRTAEIGIRVALGAQRAGVVWMVLREALWMVVAGVVVGVPAALAATRLARGILYGIRPGDPTAVLIGVAALLVVGVSAGLIPARRAAAIDPIETLRTE